MADQRATRGARKPKKTTPKKTTPKQSPKPDSRWLRCRKKALNEDQTTKLSASFQEAEEDMVWLQQDFSLPKYFVLVDRIAREYYAAWKKHGDDMHLNREQILSSVIPKVLGQIRPVVEIPEIDADIVEAVLPLLECTFDMPGPSSKLKVPLNCYSCSLAIAAHLL